MKKSPVYLMLLISLMAACKNVVSPNQNTQDVQSVQKMRTSSHPNIILVLADDLGYEVPACDGGSSYQTPNTDRIAAQGRRFTQCHSSPLCSPSRFALLTGKYNFRNYLNWGEMGRDQRTIANMFQDAGYKTYVSGKWQLGGYDTSVYIFGFDNYILWNATGTATEKGPRYKDPQIYYNGVLSTWTGVYGEDVFCDSVLNFIDNNQNDPFFIYYSMVNTHEPFCPTPGDAEYAGWDNHNGSDPTFFPSMVNYQDKKLGEIINKIKSVGLARKTVVIYMGDNGTAKKITSTFNGQSYEGGKGFATEAGTHVPCIFLGAQIAPGVDTSLICFEDFFVTLADLAGISSNGYGIQDGVSFYPQLIGAAGNPRPWIYNYYVPILQNPKDSNAIEWVQDYIYKVQLEDGKYSLRYVANDSNVVNPSDAEKQIRKSYKNIIANMH